MPSPATVTILFVVALAGTAASMVMFPDVLGEIIARLDDFDDLVACSRACRAMAEATAMARAVGRLFHETHLGPDELPGLITRVCLSPSPQAQMLLRREAQYDAVVGLVDRLLLARATTESEIAAALSLLVRTVGRVAADAISGTIVPGGQLDYVEYLRLCGIRSMIDGLDFTSVAADDTPLAVRQAVANFVATPNVEGLEPVPPGAELVPVQYASPFSGVFPNNVALSAFLLAYRQVRDVLGSRAVLLQLMGLGVRFDGGNFLKVVRVPVAALAGIYPLLRKTAQTDWFNAIGVMIDRDDHGTVDALFRIGDFAERLSAAPHAARRFLGLCAYAIKQRRLAIFTVLARHPLMAQVVNLHLEEAFDAQQSTLLHMAVRLNHVAVVSVLLSFADLQLTVLDARRHTALHYAWRPRIRFMLLREIYARHLIYGQAMPRLSWYDRMLLDFVF